MLSKLSGQSCILLSASLLLTPFDCLTSFSLSETLLELLNSVPPCLSPATKLLHDTNGTLFSGLISVMQLQNAHSPQLCLGFFEIGNDKGLLASDTH